MKSIVKDRQEEGYVSIKDIVYALIVNIALLAIIANLLSRIQTVQKLILQEKRGLKGDLILSMIFAGLIILSTCIGVKITSYSLNTRVIGAMSAGLLGGPLVDYILRPWSNICTYLLDTESICKRVCICYNFCSDFWEQDSILYFSKRQVEIYGSVPVSMFCWKSVTLAISASHDSITGK